MVLSIIIPIYNSEKYISDCLDSIYHQKISLSEFEVVCINDGSTDNSLKILEQYQKEYQNITIETIKNSGQGKARNIGMELAKGEYLFFVDSDDYIAWNSLHIILHEEKIIENKYDACFFEILRTSQEGLFQMKNKGSVFRQEFISGMEYFKQHNRVDGIWNCLVRKNFLQKHRMTFPEGKFLEDVVFQMNMLNDLGRCVYCDVDIYRYVLRENSTMSKKTFEHQKRMIEGFLSVVECVNDIKNNKRKDLELSTLLEDKRNKYIFFLQGRVAKMGLDKKTTNKLIENLKQMGCYPYKRLNKDEYSQFIYSVLHVIFVHKKIFQLLCWIYGLGKHNKGNNMVIE